MIPNSLREISAHNKVSDWGPQRGCQFTLVWARESWDVCLSRRSATPGVYRHSEPLSCFATFSSSLQVSAVFLQRWAVGILRHCLIVGTEYTLSWIRLLLLIEGFCCCCLFSEVFLWVEVSRCNPGRPGTHCVDQAELKLGEWRMGWTAHP